MSGSIGSQVSTALQGNMDSAAIARLVQQLLAAQSLGQASSASTTGGTGTGTTGTTGGSQSTSATGTNASSSGGTSISGMQASDYATMMQQLLSLLYGSGVGATGASGGGGSSSSNGSMSV